MSEEEARKAVKTLMVANVFRTAAILISSASNKDKTLDLMSLVEESTDQIMGVFREQ